MNFTNHLPKQFRTLIAKSAISFGIFVLAGCSQNIDQVSIKKKNPNTFYFFVGNADHQGGTSQGSYSPSTALGAESLGGNFKRTNSSSPSFTMTSGIGVD